MAAPLSTVDALLAQLRDIDARGSRAALKVAQYNAIHAFLAELRKVSVASRSVQITVAPDGRTYSQYADGVLPLPRFSQVPNFLQKTEGTPFSVDVRATYLTADPAAVITFVGTAGPGWGMVGDAWTYSGTGIAPTFSGRFRATFGTLVGESNIFSSQSMAAPSTDTAAPSQPIWLSPSNVTQTSLRLNWKWGADPFKAGESATGVKDVILKITGRSDVVVAAPGPGLSAQMRGYDIGASIGTSSKSGSTITYNVQGGISFGAADRVRGHAERVTLNDTTSVGCYVDGFTGPQYAKITIGFTKNDLPGSQCWRLTVFPSNGACKAKIEYRLEDNGQMQETQEFALSYPFRAWAEHGPNDTWSGYIQTDGQTPQLLLARAYSMGAAVDAGHWFCSQDNNVAISGQITQCFIQNLANGFADITGLTQGQSVVATLDPRDNASSPVGGNVGTRSATLTTQTLSNTSVMQHPARGGIWLGGSHNYVIAQFRDTAAMCETNWWGPYPNINQDIAAAVRAVMLAKPASVGTQWNTQYACVDSCARQPIDRLSIKVNQQNWYYRVTWPNGAIKDYPWSTEQCSIAFGPYCPLDSNGDNLVRWYAKDHIKWTRTGEGVAPPLNPPNPWWDGWGLDNFLGYPIITPGQISVRMNNVSVAANYLSSDPDVLDAWRTGNGNAMAAHRANWPGSNTTPVGVPVNAANISNLQWNFPGTSEDPSVLGAMNQSFDIGYSENFFDENNPSSIAGSSGAAWAILTARRLRAAARGIKRINVIHWNVSPTSFKGVSFSWAFCCQQDLLLCHVNSNGYPTEYYDQFDIHTGGTGFGPGCTVKWLGASDNTLGFGATPVVPWQKGVYRRDFVNGYVLLNFLENGDQIVDAPFDGHYFQSTGRSDGSIYNGSNVTAGANKVPIKARSGVFITRGLI